jgi:MarR family transcriptional regulator, transcriptional regulator for hemolysin
MKEFSADNMPLAVTLNRISKQFLGSISAKLNDIELERYFYPLLLIHEHKGLLSQQDLAELLFIDKVYIVRIVDFLSKRKLIKRTIHPDDRRKHLLVMTEKGNAIIPEIKKSFTEVHAESIAHLSEKELAIFAKCMKQMLLNLSAINADSIHIEYKYKKTR